MTDDTDLIDILGPTLDACRTLIAEGLRAADWRARAKENIHGVQEIVTRIDVDVERLLTRALAVSLPALPVVGEESFGPGDQFPRSCVYVDPIDGTWPMAIGQPYFSMAVCRVEDGVSEDAVVDLPHFGLRIGARRGGALRVDGDVGALPSFGPWSVLVSPQQLKDAETELRLHLPDGSPMPSMHPVPTTSVKVVLVALNRATSAVYLPRRSHGAAPWDYAAPMLVAKVAGCTCSDETGRDLSGGETGVRVPGILRGWCATWDTGWPLPTYVSDAHE